MHFKNEMRLYVGKSFFKQCDNIKQNPEKISGFVENFF
jgi:hypothetical protein